MEKLERRYIPADAVENEKLEFRQSDDGRARIAGYAAVFNKRSENLGGFVEVLRPGAFRKVLEKNPDVRCLFNHDPAAILARTKNGTLKLEENTIGLRFEAELANTSTAKDVKELIERGDVDQCSFAFSLAQGGDKWSEQKEGMYLREIFEIDTLADVSPVVYPAYSATSVSLRSAKEIYESHVADLRAQEEQLEIVQKARARRMREVELLELQIGGKTDG